MRLSPIPEIGATEPLSAPDIRDCRVEPPLEKDQQASKTSIKDSGS